MTWRQLLKKEGQNFLKWLRETDSRLKALDKLGKYLEEYLIKRLETPEQCKKFWEIIPDIFERCNDNSTFEKCFAPDAFAYAHFLYRYWRTWEVLEHLTTKQSLPLGKNGVYVLDIGTGNAPIPYAISDFYALLRNFGKLKNIEEFKNQETYIDVVERNLEMCRFMHYFSELSKRSSGPFRPIFRDFSHVNLLNARLNKRKTLLSEEYYDEIYDDYESCYSPQEANNIAMSLYRYRFIVCSYFFTLGETVDLYKSELKNLMIDLIPGSIIMILGARSSDYHKIYKKIKSLAAHSNLSFLKELDNNLRENIHSGASKRIQLYRNNVFRHLEKMLPDGIERHRYYSVFCNREPSINEGKEFALQVYRKGRWPK